MSHKHSQNKSGLMKAVEYPDKSYSIGVKSVPIFKRTDAIIRVASTGICGSDLHIFHGRIVIAAPLTLGHEIVGIVDSIGDDVSLLRMGDRVIVRGGVDEETQDGGLGDLGMLGFGGLPGAEQLMGDEFELDYVLLPDIFPTANFALDSAGFWFGDVVVVFGAGPVGLLAAYSALLRGASKVYSVDRVPQRLAKAKNIGAVPINFAEVIHYECVNTKGVTVGNTVLTHAINVAKVGSGIGMIGVYLTPDAGAATTAEKNGIYEIPIATAWLKNLSTKGGVVPLREYRPRLQNPIESGRAKPSILFEKEICIEDAPKAYKVFSNHDFI